MRMRATLALALAAVVGLGGCSGSKSDKKEEASAAVPADPYVPVEAVRNIEIGRTRDGIAVTAYGVAPGLGFGSPALRPRRGGKPGPDGHLDFDLVAKAPDARFGLGTGEPAARGVRGDVFLTPRDLVGVIGIRVHGASGGLQMQF